MSRLRKAGAASAVVTAAGLLALQTVGGFEGLRLAAYRDVVGVWTACYGETKGIKPGMKFSKADCDNLLIGSIVKHEEGMRKCLDNPDGLPAKSYVAFVSLAYNIGVAGFCASSVRAAVNGGRLRAACDAILRFNKGGRPRHEIPGLTTRRKAERMLCYQGVRNL